MSIYTCTSIAYMSMSIYQKWHVVHACHVQAATRKLMAYKSGMWHLPEMTGTSIYQKYEHLPEIVCIHEGHVRIIYQIPKMACMSKWHVARSRASTKNGSTENGMQLPDMLYQNWHVCNILLWYNNASAHYANNGTYRTCVSIEWPNAHYVNNRIYQICQTWFMPKVVHCGFQPKMASHYT